MSDVLTYFGDLMRHEFMVENFTGEDEFGNPQFSPAAGPFRCRVDLINQQRGAPGMEASELADKQEPDATIICVPCPVKVRDKIHVTVPPGAETANFVVYKVMLEFAEFDLHHIELSLRIERP